MIDTSNVLMFKKNVESERIDFHEGENITVRRGIKWSLKNGADEISLGDTDLIKEKGYDGIIKNYIVTEPLKTKCMRLCDIPAEDLLKEHDPQCRDHEGLLKVMKDAYGDDFSEYEIVTVVTFVVKQR